MLAESLMWVFMCMFFRRVDAAEGPRSDDVEWAHHLVIFVFENVAMPDVSSREIAKAHDDSRHHAGWASHDVFPTGLERVGLHRGTREMHDLRCVVHIEVKWLPVKNLEV